MYEEKISKMQNQIDEMQVQQKAIFEMLKTIMGQNNTILENEAKRTYDMSVRGSTKTCSVGTNTNTANFDVNKLLANENNSSSKQLQNQCFFPDNVTTQSLTNSEDKDNNMKNLKKSYLNEMAASQHSYSNEDLIVEKINGIQYHNEESFSQNNCQNSKNKLNFSNMEKNLERNMILTKNNSMKISNSKKNINSSNATFSRSSKEKAKNENEA